MLIIWPVRPERGCGSGVSIHAGEVHTDAHGVSGSAINHTFRLLGSYQLKEALGRSSGDVAVIVSEWFYQEVVRHNLAAKPDTYKQVPISVQETVSRGWIQIPVDQPQSDSNQPDNQLVAVRPSVGSRARLELVDELLAIPSVADESGRRRLIRILRPEISSAIPQRGAARGQVLEIINACLNYIGGLDELLTAVRTLEPGGMSVRNWKTL